MQLKVSEKKDRFVEIKGWGTGKVPRILVKSEDYGSYFVFWQL